MIIRLLSVTALALAIVAAPAEAAKPGKTKKGGKGGADIGRLLSRFDTDKSGTINGDEVARVQAIFASFAAIDTDKNGQLSESELAAVKVPEGRKGAGKGRKGATTTPATGTSTTTQKAQ